MVLKISKDYQQYFEAVFAKAVDEAMKNNNTVIDEDYTKEDKEEDARVEATNHFLNDSTDNYAVAGMYIGYAGGDAKKALNDFQDEIVGVPSERDELIIMTLKNLIVDEAELIEAGSKAFEQLNAKLLPDGLDRSDLSEEDEKAYIEEAFKIYENVGFEAALPDISGFNDEDVPYIGKPFKVTGRCKAPEWDFECLPAWNIEFEDGHKMEAYPEEICILEREQR